MPKVKRFLKEAGGIDQYEKVTIEWIPHHNPDLILFNDGKEVKTIDLSGYTTEGLHVLFKQYFRKKGSDTSGRLLLQNDDAANATSATLGAMASPLLHDARSPKPQQISPGGAAAEPTADGAAAAVLQAMNGAPVDTLNHHTPMLTELVLEPSNYPRWWLLPVMALLGLLWIWAIRVYRREQRRYSKPTTAAREEEAAAGCHVA